MKPVVVSSLKNYFGLMAAYVLIANGAILTSLRVIVAELAFMNALDVNGSSLSRQNSNA